MNFCDDPVPDLDPGIFNGIFNIVHG